jgi:hypothetical protein
VPQTKATYWNELVSAGRGVIAVIIGDKRAPGYFALDQRGLLGSFIALLAITAINAYVPRLMGLPGGKGGVLLTVVVVALLTALQIGFLALALRQMKRLDGLLPYLVAQNWGSFFLSVALLLLIVLGLASDLTLLVLAIVEIIIQVNVSRLIVRLTGGQIALLIVAQLVGVSAGLLVLSWVLPAAVSAGISPV